MAEHSFTSELKNTKSMRELCANTGNQNFKKWWQFILSFKGIYHATAGIPLISDTLPTQEDAYRSIVAVVRISYGFFRLKTGFLKPSMFQWCVDKSAKQVYSCHGLFLQNAAIYKQMP